MKTMVNDVYVEITTAEQRERITFTVSDLPHAIGDTNLLKQVWTNLISNAIKFSAKLRILTFQFLLKKMKKK